ncbi:glycoside hydrolase family 130 protein [Sphingomonas sp. ASV193]|uniref:glycoside hydrolase family 130 protein n=1 Tax=Sphingomonas sp. ASV193 TaxID=3144405 RepID=UPI0032E8B5EA
MQPTAIHPLRLTADPSRVVLRPFHLAWQGNNAEPTRARDLVEKVLAFDEKEVARTLRKVSRDFNRRHWQTRKIFERRAEQIGKLLGKDFSGLPDSTRQLIGAYFCHEYSYAAAALMNPSIVPHPDQSGIDDEHVRILMSLRAVGEGHISSIAFREGIVSKHGGLELAPEPPFATSAEIVEALADGEDGPVTVRRNRDSSVSGMVMFPVTPTQANGLEDLRLTDFTHDDGSREYIGTYTAYSGRSIRSELMRTRDFRTIDLVPMTGDAAVNKGMALFPRKVGGSYAMIGRQDGMNLFLLRSDELGAWNGGEKIMVPEYAWELIQIGNCGPPIELDEGWLLLTHGVGAMRQYAIGAALLDKDDPSKVIARVDRPILTAENDDRNGYVPNVVYTCGAMKVGDQLFMPYGISDSSVGFAFLPIASLLKAMR